VRDRSRILLCDAESQSLHALRVVLHGAGFEVDATRTAAGALDSGAVRLPAAAIIELVLPDGDGVELCRRLREWSAMPVILLSAVCDEEQLVRAFEAGADDYVTKPFRPRELVARLHAKLRRADPGSEEPCVQLDGLEIDLAARTVRREGEPADGEPLIHTNHGLGYRLADAHSQRPRLRQAAQQMIDRELLHSRISVASGPGAHMTTRVSGCGLRVA
jgi:two-component system, OmpR family, KDP operon response regulator KdpE